MNALRGRLRKSRTTDAILIISIIICAAIIITPFLLPKPLPEITLRILSRYDLSIQNEIENAFLASSYAEEKNIVNIEWLSPSINMWNLYAQSGEVDLIISDLATISVLDYSNFLRPITSSSISEISETIAGVYTKHYDAGLPIWCSFAFRPTIFDLLVNESLLQSSGLMIPETVNDLLSPDYWLGEGNSSLIGLDIPETFSVGQLFQHMLTNKLGWEEGIQKLTLLYANSQLYNGEGAALSALLRGEIAVTLSTSTARSFISLPSSISYVHMENMVIVEPQVIAIANGTLQYTYAEDFLDYLLSPQGQTIWLNIDSRLLPIRREAFQIVESEIDYGMYEEFNHTIQTVGPGVADLFSTEDIPLRYYLNSTACAVWHNLTLTWKNIFRSYENGSIDHSQFTQLSDLLSEPLEITDPSSHTNRSFTRNYALEVIEELYNVEFLLEVTRLWRFAANQRFSMIFETLTELM